LSEIKSPLRYPGGKSALCNYIEKFINENNLINCHIIEPYAGSFIVSLNMLQRNWASSATLIEKDPLIYSFWHSVFNHTDELIQQIHELDISIDTWNLFQPYRSETTLNNYHPLELGIAGLFFNRTNYSGILKANPIGGLKQNSDYTIDCRFNKGRIIKSIQKISLFHDQINLLHGDALEHLEANRTLRKGNSFFYVDPPYYVKGKSLYRYWHNATEHERLASILKNFRHKPWLLSYDDCPEIHKLYQTKKSQKIYLDYHVTSYRKNSPEILLSNKIIPPWEIRKLQKELA